MKKVFLYAYDRQNLGDDLFVHTITRRYPNVQFYMWSSRENCRTYACLPNLKIVDKDSALVRMLNRLRPSLVARYKVWLESRCDAVAYIGGSIFMEYPNWEQICTWWEYEAKNRPFYVMGANFGPWHTEAYRARMAGIFGQMRDICFRDRYSADLFEQVETVRCAPDILFSYPMPEGSVREKQVFVSIINCAGRDESHDLGGFDESYVTNMAALLRRCLDDGCSLVLASFCREEGDEAGIGKILTAMNCDDNPGIRVLHYDGTNAEELTAELARSEAVISTRFHGTVLAMAAGRPVLPILYSDKTLHMLEDLDYSGPVIDLRQPESWSGFDGNIRTLPACPVSEAIKTAAQKHFEKLDKALK